MTDMADADHYETAHSMRYWAAFFLVVTVIAGTFGFGGAADVGAPWADIAQGLCFVGFVIFLASLIAAVVARRRPPSA